MGNRGGLNRTQRRSGGHAGCGRPHEGRGGAEKSRGRNVAGTMATRRDPGRPGSRCFSRANSNSPGTTNLTSPAIKKKPGDGNPSTRTGTKALGSWHAAWLAFLSHTYLTDRGPQSGHSPTRLFCQHVNAPPHLAPHTVYSHQQKYDPLRCYLQSQQAELSGRAERVPSPGDRRRTLGTPRTEARHAL